MASQNQSVDEFIMSLVGMGFELDDAQQAVQAGKLQVNDAIEWIIAGKPAAQSVNQANASGRLQLGIQSGPVGSNPFSNPEDSKPRDPSDVEMKDKDPEDEALASRYHMKDEQRVIKERFEEKQRGEARRSAIEEKKAAKKAKDQILKQIQEDREMKKLRQAPLATSPGQKSGGGTDEKKSASAPGAQQGSALLQIRLPDGRALKHTFPPTTTLGEVWAFVKEKFKGWQNHCLMQPFPRQEYGEDDMEKELSSLGLVPTGSLVLKKLESTPTPSQAMDTEPESSQGGVDTGAPDITLPPAHPPHAPISPPPVQLPEIEQPMEPPMIPPVMPPAPPLEGAGPGHNWGTGNRMDGEQEGEQEGQQEGQEGGAVGGDQEMEAESGDDEADPPHPMPPIAGPPGGLGGMGWAQGDEWHPWGGGQAMEDVIDPENNLPHHGKVPKELAAEAARKRFAQAPKTEDEAAPAVPVVMPSIPSLTVLVIQNVCGRICDTRHPITGMQGVPSDVASLVLQHLIREKLLRPKTLQPFISCHLQRLVLDSYPYTTNELLAAIRHHRYLLHLSLASCPLITDKGLASLTGLARLKFLNISSNIKMNDGCFSVINQLPNLVTLSLEGTGISDSGVISLAESAPQHLLNLDLSRTEITQQVLPSLQAIPNLKTLNLEGTQVVGLSGVQTLSSLEILNVCNTPIVTDCLLCLGDLHQLIGLNISKTPNVQGNLALSYIAGLKLQFLQLPNRLSTSDGGMKHIANMPLQLLDLTNFIHVGDQGMEYIGQIKSLKKLRLSNTKVTDTGMFFLEGLKNLDELELDRTAVGDTGAEIINNFSLLQELSLSDTRITDEFLKSGTLNNCVMLSKLNLSKTKITDKGIPHLKLPHLSLLNLDGTGVTEETVKSLPACPQLQKITAKNLVNLENPMEN